MMQWWMIDEDDDDDDDFLVPMAIPLLVLDRKNWP